MHGSSLFSTFTYADDEQHSLDYSHFQLFLKRLRKSWKQLGRTNPLRYFVAGEYGEATWRPHYHALLFGLELPDAKEWKQTPKGVLYQSDWLNDLWQHGHVLSGEVTWESAGYCASYGLKKVTGKRAESYYTKIIPETGEMVRLVPPFARMSLKPGIGERWFRRYGKSDVTPHDRVVVEGREVGVPKYYDRLLKIADPETVEWNQYQREVRAEKYQEHTTPARLRAREIVAEAKMNQNRKQEI